MDQAKVLQGLRMMKFEAMAERWEQGGLSQAEAAEVDDPHGAPVCP